MPRIEIAAGDAPFGAWPDHPLRAKIDIERQQLAKPA
jgi:hypothetical protein